jgi:hypothetical protein
MKYLNINHSLLLQPTLGGLAYWAVDCGMNNVLETQRGLS